MEHGAMTVHRLPVRFRPHHLPTETPTHRQFTDGRARQQLRQVIAIGYVLFVALCGCVVWL